jgi:Domain of unknown function (DUF4287)
MGFIKSILAGRRTLGKGRGDWAMPAKAQEIGDEAVKAKTGKTWAQWFAVLDKAKAHTLSHQELTALLRDKHDVPRWWNQMVAVGYERARGLRVRHETAAGFSVSVSKTIGVDLADVYGATADAKTRKTWFPKGVFEQSSATANKYFRGSWNGGARLEINFYAKGAGKAQINVQANKMAAEADVEREREAWKAALEKLKSKLEG